MNNNSSCSKLNIKRPHRVKHTYIQSLNGSPDKVFPLLCPVREMDWVQGWSPELVLSESGVVEKECVFITPNASDMPDPEVKSIWVVNVHEPATYRVEMYKITPGHTLSKYEITLQEGASVDATKAEISYMHTALGKAGEAFVDAYTEEHYKVFMENWETALNYYLDTGEMQQG